MCCKASRAKFFNQWSAHPQASMTVDWYKDGSVNTSLKQFIPTLHYSTRYGPVSMIVSCIVSKRREKSSWFLAWRLLSTYPTLYYKEVQVPPKYFVPYNDSENFATANWLCSQQKSSTVKIVVLQQLTHRDLTVKRCQCYTHWAKKLLHVRRL